MATRLAEIYKSEKAQGGGLASTLGKRAIEKFDPRKMFDQEGLLAQVFPFLKAYSATGKSGKVSTKKVKGSSVEIDSSSALQSEELKIIKVNTEISAKNSMSLPGMARDINVMRQNISKLVKLNKGKPTNKADAFFQKSKEREALYESQFKRDSKNQQTTSSTGSPKSGNMLTDFAGGLLSSLSSGLGSAISGIGKGVGIGATIAGIGAGIGGFLAGIGAGAWAVDKMGGPEGIKNTLLALGEGLGSMPVNAMVALGAVAATGAAVGAVAGGGTALKSALGSGSMLGAVGAGLGLFIAGLSGGIALSELISTPEQLTSWLRALGEGFSSLPIDAIKALGTIAGAGAVAGAVAAIPGVGAVAALGAILGAGSMLGAVGAGLGLFIAALGLGAGAASFISTPESLKNWITSFGDGLKSLGEINGSNLIKVAGGIAALGPAMLAFFGSKGLTSLGENVGKAWDAVKSWFGGDKKDEKKQSPIEKIIELIKPLENVDGKKISDVADSFSKLGTSFHDLTNGIKKMSEVSPEDVAKAFRSASIVSRSSTSGQIGLGTQGVSGQITRPTPNVGTGTTPTKTDGVSLLNKVLDDEGVQDPAVRQRIFALAQAESSLNPNAKGPVIKEGMHEGDQARGLLQIMPKTAPEVGYTKEEIENDPEKAAKAGVKYFLKNYKKFNSLDLATIAHHAGPGGAQKYKETGSINTKDRATNLKTTDYLSKVQKLDTSMKIPGAQIAAVSTGNAAAANSGRERVVINAPNNSTTTVASSGGGGGVPTPTVTPDRDALWTATFSG